MTDCNPRSRERRLPARFRDGAIADIQTPGSVARAKARVNRARRRAAREGADTHRENGGEHGPVEQFARLNLGGNANAEGAAVERPRRERRLPSRFREGATIAGTPGSVARANARVNRTRRRVEEGTRLPQQAHAPTSTPVQRPAAVSSDFPVVSYVDLGERSVTCTFCGAKLWPMEKTRTSLCCHKGQTAWLSQVFDQPAPEPLKTLYNRNIPHSKRSRFLKQIRAYNSALAMASSQVRMANPESGVSMLAIQGTVYHNIGALQPTARQEPRFAQLWILDNQENMLESRIRSHSSSDLDPELLRELQTMLMDSNSFVRQFRQVRDIPEEHIENYRIYIRADGKIEGRSGDSNVRDHRRYRPPTDQEQVAGFMPGGEHEGVDEGRSLIVACRDDGGLRRISDCNAAFDPLFFVLLHPRGELGWHPGLKRAGGGNLTNRQWAAYFMHDRDNTNCNIVHAERLYQVWIIDQYAKIETQRLRFLRRADSQKRLRVDVYQGLLDSLNGGEGEQMRLGRLVLLPSSFIGGPRFMAQCYQDAMALVREFGKPDLFVTMTCNPKWPDIQRELLPGQTANDRPDLVARVFKMKLKQLTDDITVNHIFGNLQGMVYVIEFQKRGLPHAHLLIILKPGFKPVSPEDVDRFVWAEICGKEEHPLLYEMIVTHMLHGPCGPANPHCPCMENGVCSKKFPKQYSDNTIFTDDSFPTYRRREGTTYTKRTARGEFTFDNRWVVPYNPYLLCKYQCHINVEVCNTVSAVKYLYKYVYKGHDRAEVRVHRDMATSEEDLQNEVRDEVNEYVDGRYISASEASCRIYGFDLHEMTPTVHRLPVHLPGQQNVHFREGEDPSAVLARSGNTKLTGWFEFNKTVAAQQAADPSTPLPPALTTTYPNVAKIAVWDKTNKKWKPRTQGGRTPVGRMYHVSPTDQERFYLRMLLLIVPGATSFEDVRTTGEGPSAIVHETFKAACVARGLLQDDGEWRLAMEEARLASTPKALRMMFVSLLLYVEVEKPLALWTEFKDDMTEDFLHAARTRNPTREYDEHLYALALADIQRQLGETNKSLETYGLPPIRNASRFGAVEEELALYDTEKQREAVERMLPLLNHDQKAAYDVLLNTIEKSPESRDCNVYFLDGVGGSGKTTLYNTRHSRMSAPLEKDPLRLFMKPSRRHV
jgi:hypothetical protein